MNYVYRFLDYYENTIYIGKTSDIDQRMRRHFTDGHLAKADYNLVTRIQYLTVGTAYEAEILETKLIGVYRPRCNSEKKFCRTDAAINTMPDVTWIEYPFARTGSGIKRLKNRFPFLDKSLSERRRLHMILDYNKDKLNYNAEFLKRNFGLTSNDCQILSSVYDDIDAGNYNLEFSDLSPHITASEEEQARELSIAFIYKQQNTANFHDLQTAGIVTSLTEDIFTVGVLAV